MTQLHQNRNSFARNSPSAKSASSSLTTLIASQDTQETFTNKILTCHSVHRTDQAQAIEANIRAIDA
jgi:hypothetical protein